MNIHALGRFSKLLITVLLLIGFPLTTLHASVDYFRLDLPKNTTRENPQPFYCTAKPNKTQNPRILMANHAQLITGFKNTDPNAPGQLIIYADQLNQVYFLAYQDPDEIDLPGYVQAMGTGEVDITCALGMGESRTLMPGDFGVKHR